MSTPEDILKESLVRFTEKYPHLYIPYASSFITVDDEIQSFFLSFASEYGEAVRKSMENEIVECPECYSRFKISKGIEELGRELDEEDEILESARKNEVTK